MKTRQALVSKILWDFYQYNQANAIRDWTSCYLSPLFAELAILTELSNMIYLLP